MTTATVLPLAPPTAPAPAIPRKHRRKHRKHQYAAFPDFPPRNDMQNLRFLAYPAHHAALYRHFGESDTTLIFGEVPIGWNLDQREGLLIPDLLVAFDVDFADVIAEKGYAIERHGKPPDFVLEVASDHTAPKDEVGKRTGYAAFGVPEYWRFDDQWGQRYATGLSGDRLAADGVYQPIAVHRVDANRYWGHSAVLNLDLCWEYGQLRWYDPVARRYLPTYDDAYDGQQLALAERQRERVRRIAAEDVRDAALEDRDRERAGRQQEQARRIAAENAQAAAENAQAAAEARIQELEAQLKGRPPAAAAPGL